MGWKESIREDQFAPESRVEVGIPEVLRRELRSHSKLYSEPVLSDCGGRNKQQKCADKRDEKISHGSTYRINDIILELREITAG